MPRPCLPTPFPIPRKSGDGNQNIMRVEIVREGNVFVVNGVFTQEERIKSVFVKGRLLDFWASFSAL